MPGKKRSAADETFTSSCVNCSAGSYSQMQSPECGACKPWTYQPRKLYVGHLLGLLCWQICEQRQFHRVPVLLLRHQEQTKCAAAAASAVRVRDVHRFEGASLHDCQREQKIRLRGITNDMVDDNPLMIAGTHSDVHLATITTHANKIGYKFEVRYPRYAESLFTLSATFAALLVLGGAVDLSTGEILGSEWGCSRSCDRVCWFFWGF